MLIAKKINLTRFKKSMQGLVDFATLLEQADPAHRQKIIEQAEQQDKDFLHKAMRKVVFFDELIYIDETIIAEILSKTSPKVLAYALKGMEENFRSTMLKQIGYRELRLFKDEEEKMGAALSPGLILGAQKQILKMARHLESQNKFVFEISSCPRFNKKKTATKETAAGGSPTANLAKAAK